MFYISDVSRIWVRRRLHQCITCFLSAKGLKPTKVCICLTNVYSQSKANKQLLIFCNTGWKSTLRHTSMKEFVEPLRALKNMRKMKFISKLFCMINQINIFLLYNANVENKNFKITLFYETVYPDWLIMSELWNFYINSI